MLTIICACGRRFQTVDEHAGKKTRCPVCGKTLIAPHREAEARPREKSEKSAPPAWWTPRGQGGAATGPDAAGPMPRATRPRIEDLPGMEAPPAAKDPARPASRSGPIRLALGIGAVFLSISGLLWWLITPGSKPGPAQAEVHAVVDRDPPARDPSRAVGRSPAGDLPTPDGPRAEVGPKSKADPAPPSPSPASGSAPEAGRPRLKLLAPAYFYPAGPGLKQWERLIQAASRVPIVAIANPSSGPGEEANSDYTAVVGRAKRGGVLVVGYVATDYAKRPLAEVRDEIDRWARFYPEIGGIFLDSQASEPGHADYYASLRDHAREKIKGAAVITNPGAICAEEYSSRLTSVDICLFSSATGFEAFRLPRWAERHTSGRLGAMPSQVAGAERMRDRVQLAAARGFGLIYVTDARLPNPWDRLPSYWDDEVEAVRQVNAGRTP
jgi:Spherulation-specific family 4